MTTAGTEPRDHGDGCIPAEDVQQALDGIHPHDLATIADRDQVCLRAGHHCAMPLMTRLGVPATARASFYVYTLKEEIDRLVSSIKEAQRIFA